MKIKFVLLGFIVLGFAACTAQRTCPTYVKKIDHSNDLCKKELKKEEQKI